MTEKQAKTTIATVISMLEADFQRDVIQCLEAAGALVIKTHGHAMQRNGLPDLIVMHPRVSCWLELKSSIGVGKANQRLMIVEMRRRGTFAAFARPSMAGEDYDFTLSFDGAFLGVQLLSLWSIGERRQRGLRLLDWLSVIEKQPQTKI